MKELLYTIFALVAVGALYLAAARGRNASLAFYAFLIPWFGLQANFGVTLTTDRIAGLVLVLAGALKLGPRGFRGFGPFYLFIMLDTVAQSVTLPYSVSNYSAAQGEYRWIFQLVVWTLLISPGAILAATSEGSARLVYRWLCWAGATLGAMAILQFFWFYAFGVDLFPLSLFSDAAEQRGASFATDSFLGGLVFRVSALGGEPKHLAYGLVVGLTILASDQLIGAVVDLPRRTKRLMTAVMLLALLMTFSTQGLSMLAGNTVLLVAYAWYKRGLTRQQALLAGSVVVLGLGLLVIPGLWDVLVYRTLGRLQETGGMEDWNVAVWAWLLETPWAIPLGVGLGNVHFYAAPYIPQESLFYMRDSVFVAKSGGLRLLSEVGLVGLLLFLLTCARALRGLVARAGARYEVAGAHAAIAGLVIIDWLLTGDGPWFVFIAIGAAFAANRVVEPAARPAAQQAA